MIYILGYVDVIFNKVSSSGVYIYIVFYVAYYFEQISVTFFIFLILL